MTNCTGCYHSEKDKSKETCEECRICIRNPEYPSKKMPFKATVNGIEVQVPQDMYISKDRKKLEDRLKEKLVINLRKLIETLKRTSKKEKTLPYPYPSPGWEPYPPEDVTWTISYQGSNSQTQNEKES